MTAQVLIVDDDVAHLAVLRDALAQYASQFRVVTAPDGVEALNLLRQQHVDLVVTDLRMPRMDGFALLLRLAQEQGSSDITGLTHQDLAESVGTYRETATQVLNDLKAQGYIDIGRKRITILDSDGLAAVAEE